MDSAIRFFGLPPTFTSASCPGNTSFASPE
jgi:hypothetical protein